MTAASKNAFLLRAIASVRTVEPQSNAGTIVELQGGDEPLIKDLGNGLCTVYLVDEGAGFTYVQKRHLAESSFTMDGLHECALNNLAQRAQGKATVRQHGTVHGVFLDGNFEASLILIDHLWDETLARMAPNGFVIAIPARDVLAFCDAASPEGVSALRGVVQRVFAGGSHLLTKSLYRRREVRWEPIP